VVGAEFSPLFNVSDSESDFDQNAQYFMTDQNGDLNAAFKVPDPFTAPDPNAVCPRTAGQLASVGQCFIAIADE
jgi:hypothetical protein